MLQRMGTTTWILGTICRESSAYYKCNSRGWINSSELRLLNSDRSGHRFVGEMRFHLFGSYGTLDFFLFILRVGCLAPFADPSVNSNLAATDALRPPFPRLPCHVYGEKEERAIVSVHAMAPSTVASQAVKIF
jgi:hypothetical protein